MNQLDSKKISDNQEKQNGKGIMNKLESKEISNE